MPVSSPAPNDTRSKVADWLEVLALASPRGVATRADLLGLYDLLGDNGHALEVDAETGETLEGEILEDARATAADVVLEELQHRIAVLGLHYPFDLEFRSQSWRLVMRPDAGEQEIAASRACYVFCLLTCAIRDNRIRGNGLAPLSLAMPNHFQAIATQAAAGLMGGDAYSFGSPRPSGLGFRPALTEVSTLIKLGKPLEHEPLWSNGQEKDAGIDVIAWRDFADGRPGKLVLLGQVASGNNWIDKTVKSDTPTFMSWFSEHPTKHYIPAIFIPFPQHHNCTGRPDAAFEDVASAEAWLREQEFGLVIDRLRIVVAAAQRLVAANDVALGAMNGWIEQTLVVARAAA